MDKEKVVVILLLVTIILSIASVIVTFSLNIGDFRELNINPAPAATQKGNIEVEIIEPPVGGEAT